MSLRRAEAPIFATSVVLRTYFGCQFQPSSQECLMASTIPAVKLRSLSCGSGCQLPAPIGLGERQHFDHKPEKESPANAPRKRSAFSFSFRTSRQSVPAKHQQDPAPPAFRHLKKKSDFCSWVYFTQG